VETHSMLPVFKVIYPVRLLAEPFKNCSR
jgi:hypothetical protein